MVSWICTCFRDWLKKFWMALPWKYKTKTVQKLNTFKNSVQIWWQIHNYFCFVFKLGLKVFYLNLFIENKLTQKTFNPFVDNP